MKKILVFLLLLLVFFMGFLLSENHQFKKWVQEGHLKIQSMEFGNRTLDSQTFPPLLQSYLNKVILQPPSHSFVHFTQAGDFRMNPKDKMSDFTAEQWVSLVSPQFSWVAQIQMGFLSVTVCDRLIDGRGELQARLFSSLALAKGSGESFLRGELLRYLAELPWYPMSILNQKDVVWNQIEKNKVTGTLSVNSVTATVEYTFNEEGLIQSIFVPDREKSDGKTSEPKPWLGEFSHYQEREGVLIPLQGQVSWLLDSGKFTYFIGNISSYRLGKN